MIKKFLTLAASYLSAMEIFAEILTGELSDKIFPRREITDG